MTGTTAADRPSGVKAMLGRLTSSRPVIAWQRYGQGRGTVLAGGITYAAFFSLFPALAAGFTIFGLVLGDRTDLQDRVVDAVNEGIGTAIVKVEPDDPGIVTLSSLTSQDALTITGLVALAGLLFTGLGWLGAVRESIRAMFGQPVTPGNVVVSKTKDTLALVVVGLVVLTSALSGVVVNAVAGWLLGLFGLEGSTLGSFALRLVSALVLLGVDFLVLILLFRFLAGVRLPFADLRDGALVGAIALGIVKFFAGFLLSRLGGNQFLAAFAVVVGLLVWLNLIARILLLAASWGAVTAIERGHLEPLPPLDDESEEAVEGAPSAAAATAAVVARRRAARTVAAAGGARAAVVPVGRRPAPVRPAFVPVVGARAADRVSVAAGAVLGAAGVVSVRAAVNGVRTAAGAARRVFGVFGDSRDDD